MVQEETFKRFEEFVIFLFPNDEIDATVLEAIKYDCIFDFILEQSYEEKCRRAVVLLKDILDEMCKKNPDAEYIDECLTEIMEILGTWRSSNIENFKTYRDFMET